MFLRVLMPWSPGEGKYMLHIIYQLPKNLRALPPPLHTPPLPCLRPLYDNHTVGDNIWIVNLDYYMWIS